MTSQRRDNHRDAPQAGPAGPAAFHATKVRRLKLVPSPADRPDTPPTEDWAAALERVAEARCREAFGRLFTHFAPRVKSYLVRTGSPDNHAEELAQEVLATVWRKAALFNPERAAVSTWIFAIARNLRIDAVRRRQTDDAGDECFDFDVLEADQAGVADGVDASRLAHRVREAMRQLPPEQAQVLRLSFYDDEPHARIASELGLPLGTVKSRIRLAVAHLRRLIDP